jgi:formamidopyrimidine-DNA glycosylase
MPELPEVETIARGMQRHLAGVRIVELWQGPLRNRLSASPAALKKKLLGAVIAGARRVGKQIVVTLQETDGSPRADWVIHLGMTGRISICPPEEPRLPHTHLVASLSDGRELRFADPRRFGRLQVMEPEGAQAPGAEPLEIEAAAFAALFHPRRTPIKSALLNQRLMSGVGNIYADEALFRAGIRPSRLASSLTRAELAALHHALQQVLREAVAAGGSSISDYADTEGRAGLFQFRHNVYQKTGRPCPVCQRAIRRVVIGGRSSHFCPGCQK